MGILRFPNAVSDIGKFIETFCTIYKALNTNQPFSHDDAVRILIQNGLVSSSGAIGNEALKRSTRDDRTRDPLYNQHKMYSEVYRMLGWYLPGTQRTNFKFSDYSYYINEASSEIKKRIFAECLLSIVFPNPNVENRAGNSLRPFAFLLRLMNAVDGVMCRDEMILAVLTLMDDRKKNALEEQITVIKALRGNYLRLDRAFQSLSQNSGIQTTTLQNYTRFVLGAISYCGWAESSSDKTLYNKSIVFYKLTESGREAVNRLNTLKDIRNEDLAKFTLEERGAFTLLNYFLFLERVDYHDDGIVEIVNRLTALCQPIFKTLNIRERSEILYSPFQQSTSEEIEKANEIDNSFQK